MSGDGGRAGRETTAPPREPVRVLVRRYAVAIVLATVVLLGMSVVVAPSGWYVAALVPLAPLAAACAVIDAYTHRIPTPLVRIAGVVGVILLSVAAVADDAWGSLGRALLAGAIVGAAFFAKWWITHGGTGMGDVRLAAVLGLYAGWLGWEPVLLFVVVAYLFALPLAVYRLARRRREPIPFGPALVVGWYATMAVLAL